MQLLRPIALALLASVACVDAFVNLPVGPIAMSVAVPVGEVPSSLLEADGTVRTIACSDASPCPATGTDAVTLRCVSSVCRLAPFPLGVTTPDIDLTTYDTYRSYADGLTAVRIAAVNLQLTGARPNNTLGPVEFYWSGATPTPEYRLGTIPATALTAGSSTIPVVVDNAGTDALVAAILGGAVRFRVRIAGTLEVGGGALPDPQLGLNLNLLLHLEGSL